MNVFVMKKNYFKSYLNQFSKILTNYNHKDFLEIIKILKK
jgi:hypothetical protein